MITNEQMTKRDKLVKEKLIDMLISEGYGTYAKRLKEFDILVADIYHNSPIDVAAMFPYSGEIVINTAFLEDDETFSQLSIIIRHELLHFLLMHEQRLVDHLKQTDPDFENTYKKASIHQIANYAMDWELSDIGYDDHDKEVVRLMHINGQVIGGLILSDDHPEWVKKPMEELFDLLRKEIEQNKQQLKQKGNQHGNGQGPSQEYADAWNLIMSKYDDPNVSDKEINELINQITSGNITNL